MKGKRYNKETVFLLTAGSVCLAFMAFTTMVFPAATWYVDFEDLEVSGIFAVFGGTVKDDYALKFNILSLIGYLLTLVSLVLNLKAFDKKDTTIHYISVGVSLFSAVIIFLETVIVGLVNNISNLSLGIGPILGGIFMVLVAILNISCVQEKNKAK